MTGQHLLITTIHDKNGMNMGYDDLDDLLPSTEWTGLFVDLIDWVADHAGFTYELFSPSGLGPSCIRPEGHPLTPKTFATQFNCGEEDVHTFNKTHVYWAGFYISPLRLTKNLFTVPFLSDVGLGLVLQRNRPATWDTASVMWQVFTWRAWLLILCTAIFFAWVIWFADHGGTSQRHSEVLAECLPEEFTSQVTLQEGGYLVYRNMARTVPTYLKHSYSQMISDPAIFEPRTTTGSILVTPVGFKPTRPYPYQLELTSPALSCIVLAYHSSSYDFG